MGRNGWIGRNKRECFHCTLMCKFLSARDCPMCGQILQKYYVFLDNVKNSRYNALDSYREVTAAHCHFQRKQGKAGAV